MNGFERFLISVLTLAVSFLIIDDTQQRKELKDAKSEIELIDNFCADSIPPRVLENGRAEKERRD